MRLAVLHQRTSVALAALVMIIGGGCGGPTDTVGHAATPVRIDLSPLEERVLAGQQQSGVSVVETVALITLSADGARQEDSRQLAAGETEATFEVTVPIGTVTFQARVLSNNGTPIYSGEETVEVTGDQTVTILVDPIDAVLVIFPDSLDLDLCGEETPCGGLTVFNAGSSNLAWQFQSASPTLEICEQVPRQCFVPLGGVLSPDSLRPVFLQLIGAPAGTVALRFGSQVGHVDVAVTVPPAGMPPPPPPSKRGNRF